MKRLQLDEATLALFPESIRKQLQAAVPTKARRTAEAKLEEPPCQDCGAKASKASLVFLPGGVGLCWPCLDRRHGGRWTA